MNTIVVKFGGTSLASAAQIKKAAAIVRDDPARRFVVVSAPGKRGDADTKVTDLLYRCCAAAVVGADYAAPLAEIETRFRDSATELGVRRDLDADFARIRAHLQTAPERDYMASRGEYLNGRLIAQYLDAAFIDPAETIRFGPDGQLDLETTCRLLGERLAGAERAVIPGFYGALPDGRVRTFTRGGSDITGAIVARAAQARLYENWTDVSGLLTADPRVVESPRVIDYITYTELRELNHMEGMLGIPVVPIAASLNEGVEELVNHAIHVAHYQERPGRQDFCAADENGGAVHRCLHGIMHLIQDHAERAGIPVRFAATKLAEGDGSVARALNLTENERGMIEHIVSQMEEERGLDRAAAIADMRFSFIKKVVDATVVKPRESRERTRSAAIDRLLTGQWTAIPLFILIMGLIFVLTFNVIGPFFQGIIQTGLDALMGATSAALASANPIIRSFIVDGALNGVGTVILFFPIIVTMFFFLSLLQDTGYMARVAFFMDRALRKIGLSGRSIVPMIMGFGCTVPAVMATRTLPSSRDRKLTILLTPFMSCVTKLTIYGYVAGAFFPRHAGFIIIGLYLIGIVMAVVVGALSHNTAFKGEAVPFVMELPNYRMPSPKSVAQLVWDKSKDFITRAFTVIFAATIVVWVLQSFSPQLEFVESPENSILALLAGWLAPLFAPLGFGDWRFVIALIVGFMAKETVVSTLTVLFVDAAALTAALTPAAALSYLVFCLLYTPCVAAVAAIRRELGGKWSTGIVVAQCAIAWLLAFITYLIAGAVLG
ncbi:MAG: ferrous iron transport protein B [Clostridia bacterium]|nr:ferrous iron transport protein B [Clostridia bacterium]